MQCDAPAWRKTAKSASEWGLTYIPALFATCNAAGNNAVDIVFVSFTVTVESLTTRENQRILATKNYKLKFKVLCTS